MYLQAGVSSGTLCECHHLATVACSPLADNLPEPENGWLAMNGQPGLGFDIKPEAIAEFTART